MRLDSLLAGTYPDLLVLLLAAWAAAAAACGKTLLRALREPLGRRGAATVAAVFLAALAGRLAMPAGHRVFFDEYEHVDIAANVSRSGMLAESVAHAPGFDALEPSTWPGLFHVALGGVFKVFGPSEAAAYRFNALFGAAAAALAGLCAALMFGDAPGALAAGAFCAALPAAVVYSTGADLTAFSAFWLAASLLALELCARKPERRTAALLALTLACAAHARFENVVLAGAAALRLSRARAFPRRWALPMLGGYAAAVAPLAAIVWRNRAGGLPGFGEPLSAALTHLGAHLPANVSWALGFPPMWLLVLPALAACAFQPSSGEKPPLAALALTAAAYLAVYSAFYRGDFSLGTEDRYAVSALLPVLVAAGCGIKRLPFPEKGRWAGALGAAFLFLGLSWGSYLPRVDAAHEAEERILRGAVAALPEQAWVAAFSAPAVTTAAGRRVVSIPALLADWPSWRARVGQAPVALLEDFWWDKRPEQAARAERLLSEGRDRRVLGSVDAGDGRRYVLVGYFPRRLLSRP